MKEFKDVFKKYTKKIQYILGFHKKRQLNWNFFHWDKKSKQRKTLLVLRIIIIVLVVYFGSIAWILRGFIREGFLSGKTLIIFTNEAETRPCGGFASAFGEIQFFPPRISFQNSYVFEDTPLGEATAPLDQISKTKNFWDLGTSPDLEICAEDFRTAYETITKTSADHVLLFDIKTAEKIFSLFGEMKMNGRKISSDDFFSELSRIVSNVDRHDETALAQRKLPLSLLGKKMLWRTIFNPSLLPRIATVVARSVNQGDLFSPSLSPSVRPEKNDFAVIEWNLGGAKSSRFLKKMLHITARETFPRHWGFFVELQIEHLGGIDEPLSQEWKGGFDIQVPEFLNADPIFVPAEISPGRAFRKTFAFEYKGDLSEFSVFRPRGQEIFADISISLFPQKTFSKSTFDTHENVGIFVGEIKRYRRIFRWEETPDTTSPFITLHEFIPVTNLSQELKDKWTILFSEEGRTPLFAEIHLNEKITFKKDFSVSLLDLDKANNSTDNPVFSTLELLEDERTILLAFSQKTPQPEERFSLEISGISDLSGNLIVPTPRTLIYRLD